MDRSIEERIAEIASEAAGRHDVEFVHSEILGAKRNLTVRIFIDKPSGVTIEDCSAVSRSIEEVLDSDDIIPSAYVLEVSSPGLDRGLYKLQDYERFAGKKAKIKTASDINGQTNFTGRIKGVDGDTIVFEDKTNGEVRINFPTVVKGNLQVDLSEEFGGKRK